MGLCRMDAKCRLYIEVMFIPNDQTQHQFQSSGHDQRSGLHPKVASLIDFTPAIMDTSDSFFYQLGWRIVLSWRHRVRYIPRQLVMG